MLPRKKLEFYAKRYGLVLEDIKLTDEDCERICRQVGVKVYVAKELRGNIGILIDCVLNNEDFKARHFSDKVSPAYLEAKYADYAANECMAAFAGKPVL
ncbi:MAG: hypothetical protein MJZ68_00735 [archaeon]|nr:hypothetical protein [archaeon]